MGCPDWPKCFGSWIPPTSESQLPDDYKETYKQKREKKVNRLIGFLNKIGMHSKAEEIAQSNWILEAHAFSFPRAYTEYVNRLWGALTGIFALIAAFFSIGFRKSAFWKMAYTFLGVFFVAYNGWLGSLVVDTNLLGGIVTIHFVLAFLALFFFMLGYYHSKPALSDKFVKHQKIWISITLSMGLIQLISGTLVREQADFLSRSGTVLSTENMELLGSVFNLHRITAPIMAIILLFIWINNQAYKERKNINTIYLVLFGILVIQIISGMVNVSQNFPVVSQLLHVVAGSLLISGLLFLVIQEFKIKSIR